MRNAVDLVVNSKEELFALENKLERKKKYYKRKKLKAELVEKKRIIRESEEKIWKEMDKIVY